MKVVVEREFAGRKLSITTGEIAKQADGCVLVQYGETVVLVAAQSGPPRPGIDFFPLTCDYRERMAAAGKFPGGFLKREGRPTTREILTSRLIDRPIRPLFPSGYHEEVQVMANVLAFDHENDPDILAMLGASAALGFRHLVAVEFLKFTWTDLCPVTPRGPKTNHVRKLNPEREVDRKTPPKQ